MANLKNKLSLAELLILVALVAGMFGLWRRFGGYWSPYENSLALTWLGAWLASYLGGRIVLRRSIIPCGVICAATAGGYVAWHESLWQVDGIVAVLAGILGGLAASIPGFVAWLVERWKTAPRRSCMTVGLLVTAGVVVTAGIYGRWYLRARTGPPQPRVISQLATVGAKFRSPLRSSQDARFLATGYYAEIEFVRVVDTWFRRTQVVKVPKNALRFCDLSPSGDLVAITDKNDLALVLNRHSGKSLGPFGSGVRWMTFSSEGELLVTAGAFEPQVWSIAGGDPRRIASRSPVEDQRDRPVEARPEWLRGFGVDIRERVGHDWIRHEPSGSKIHIAFIGLAGNERTALFCEWEEKTRPPLRVPKWIESLPFFRTPAPYLTVNLAAVDLEQPMDVRRSATTNMDSVLGRRDETLVGAFLSGDRQTVIVFDGHYHVAMWRVKDL